CLAGPGQLPVPLGVRTGQDLGAGRRHGGRRARLESLVQPDAIGTLPVVLKTPKNLPLLLVIIFASACSLIPSGTPDSTTTTRPTTTTTERACVKVTSGSEPIDSGARATDAMVLSGEI